jgi:hypothetical protein
MIKSETRTEYYHAISSSKENNLDILSIFLFIMQFHHPRKTIWTFYPYFSPISPPLPFFNAHIFTPFPAFASFLFCPSLSYMLCMADIDAI